MGKKDERLTAWAVTKIKTEYKEDVSLLIGHDAYKLEKDVNVDAVSFYFPISEKANQLAKTFTIDGIGYDLFPMSWERMERIANLDEDNASCLVDATILYYRNDEDKQRFLKLQNRLQDNLQNPKYTFNKALEKLNIAMDIYQTMMFEETHYKVRKASGFIVSFLSSAVAYTNQTYSTNPHTDQIAALLGMKNVPVDFVRLYQFIVRAGSTEELKNLCHEMIANTRQFLSAKKGKMERTKYKQNFKELASWYQELSYAWREIYHWCDQNDVVRGFIRGCFLQSELDIVGEEFGLGEMDLLSAFSSDDMTAYRKRAGVLEKQIISTIEKHGVAIETYNSVEDFLKVNV